jgi:HAD superfamily hydrolase (TIGR01457 family)
MINNIKELIKDSNLIEELNDIALFIFDLDGVIYRGKKLINNSDIIIKNLRKRGLDIIFNTNNSTQTRDMYVEKLKKLGIKTTKEEIYTSAHIAAMALSAVKSKANVFIIGEIGLQKELELEGHTVFLDDSAGTDIDFVVVGLDRNLTYDKVKLAQNYILDHGAKFYATNPDATLPVKKGVLPGAGVMVKAVQIATGKKPLKIFGKPHPTGINLILENYDTAPDKAAIIGDRIETDIVAGNRAKIKTILVLTGVTTKEMAQDFSGEFNTPDIIINSLRELFVRQSR